MVRGGSTKERHHVSLVSALNRRSKGLFRFENFLNFDTVALSFLFDKHCPIIE